MKKQYLALRSVRRLGFALGLAALTISGLPKLYAQNGPPSPSPFSIMTYQGKLDDFGGGPADGRFDFRVSAVTPPVPCFGTDCGWFTNCPDCSTVVLGTSTVTVDHGLFTLPINMPTGMVHTVNGTFLKLEVRPNGNGEFSALLPMQPITAAPLAAVAQSVVGPIPASSLTGTMPTGMLTGVFSSPLTLSNPGNVFVGDGSQLANVNATTIGGVAPCELPCLQNFWKLSGNDNVTAGSFLGTPWGNSLPLVLKVQGETVMRCVPRPGVPNGANLIGGDIINNIPAGAGSVICGGGGTEPHAPYTPHPNIIANDHSAIVGGVGNLVEGRECFIGGGWENKIGETSDGLTHYITICGGINNRATNVDSAFIGGGNDNLVAGNASVVAGGTRNQATGLQGTVGGGVFNTAFGNYATVPGGSNNMAMGSASLAAGSRARAMHDGSFVWSDSQNADFPSTANNQFAVRAQNGVMIQGATTTLDLRGDGAIRVAGAGVGSLGPVFIHRSSAANITGHITTIDHPLANGDPNAILLVTHNFSADNSSTPYEPAAVGVWYNGSRWTIYHENTGLAMPAGRAFNVMIIKP